MLIPTAVQIQNMKDELVVFNKFYENKNWLKAANIHSFIYSFIPWLVRYFILFCLFLPFLRLYIQKLGNFIEYLSKRQNKFEKFEKERENHAYNSS